MEMNKSARSVPDEELLNFRKGTLEDRIRAALEALNDDVRKLQLSGAALDAAVRELSGGASAEELSQAALRASAASLQCYLLLANVVSRIGWLELAAEVWGMVAAESQTADDAG